MAALDMLDEYRRGALDAGATAITESMKLASAEAIASAVGDDLRPDFIIPSVFDTTVAPRVRATQYPRGT